jgi:hypothetical protein
MEAGMRIKPIEGERMSQNGDTNDRFGLYKSLCCEHEVMVREGADGMTEQLPETPNHIPMFVSGDKCQQFGVYQAACCANEIVLINGAVFPDCPTHRRPADWILVSVIGPSKPSAKPAA